jgi:hypothetical protein
LSPAISVLLLNYRNLSFQIKQTDKQKSSDSEFINLRVKQKVRYQHIRLSLKTLKNENYLLPFSFCCNNKLSLLPKIDLFDMLITNIFLLLLLLYCVIRDTPYCFFLNGTNTYILTYLFFEIWAFAFGKKTSLLVMKYK